MSFLATLALVVMSFLPSQPQPAGLVSASLGLDAPEQHPVASVNYQPLALPIRAVGVADPSLGAGASLALDMDSATTLYAHNAETELPIASITKLVTVMTILATHSPEEIITVPPLPAYQPADERMGLIAGERFRVADLVKAALIGSANDAADALALADSGTIPAFSGKMNTLVHKWGIIQARFNNPTGLVDDGNSASARALAQLAKIALASEVIRGTISQPRAVITDQAGRAFTLTATNQLLTAGTRWHGIKTGYTPAAGQSFVGLVTINQHQVITVMLHSPDRFGESQALANWVEKNYQWQ
jgi:serine-type D-Ala-D-Ala carboxypeptidase (penicillin-binding protein 5/6)